MKSNNDFIRLMEELFGKEAVHKYLNDHFEETDYSKNKEEKKNNNLEENKFSSKNENKDITKVEDNRYKGYQLEVIKTEDGIRTGVKLHFCAVGLTKDQIEITECERVITVKSLIEVPYGFGFINQKTKIGDIYDLTKIEVKLENGELTIYAPVSKDKFAKPKKISIN